MLMSIPFISSCISDDCTDCADMTYDTKVRLKVTWPSNLSSTKSTDLYINNFTLFVFNSDGSVNTIKKVNNPSGPVPYSTNVTMNITSSAKYIYAIANCDDILSTSPTSYIAKQVNQNMATLKTFFDNTFAVSLDSIYGGSQLVLTGYTDSILQSGTNPYNYAATVRLKPIVSKFDIKVSSVGTTPSDYIGCIQSINAFVLNSRSRAKLFSPNITFPYIHGAYESFWMQYQRNFEFNDTNRVNSNLAKVIPYTISTSPFTTTELSIYSSENDITLTPINKPTLVVIKIRYKMTSIDGTPEVFDRFFTVSLTTPTISTSSNIRGKLYTINFSLSGKFWGALSPLSSMMAPYSPLPSSKGKKDLIYVPQEKYSTVKVSNWN